MSIRNIMLTAVLISIFIMGSFIIDKCNTFWEAYAVYISVVGSMVFVGMKIKND